MPNSLERQYAFADQHFYPYRSTDLVVKVADNSWEKQRYFTLRQQVFAQEQKILTANEQDENDFKAIPIVALSSNCGQRDDVVGAVRIYQTTSIANGNTENTWYGGRLCVSAPYRGFHAVGKSLINEAVSRAKDLGCTVFLANVQAHNEAYFQSLHWESIHTLEVSGRKHVHMRATLTSYPFMPRRV